MASHGIKDQVAIVGMGCTSFGEHWDKSLDDLIIEASGKATKSAGIETDLIDAYWFGTSQSAASGIALANLSPKPYGLPKTLTTSLNTALAAIVPLVLI
mgnify:CR=1 FL=1